MGHSLSGQSRERDSANNSKLDYQQPQREGGDDKPGAPFQLKAGDAVGNFDILEALPEGGMGAVFKARDRRLSRVVALKMIRSGAYIAADDLQRLVGEAKTMAGLVHENIVRVYGLGDLAGRPFIVMEWIDGGRLLPPPREEARDFRRVAELVRKVAQAVHFAHEHGILHRDLKSANILIDQNGQPKVTDFGIAQRLDIGAAQATETPQHYPRCQGTDATAIRTVTFVPYAEHCEGIAGTAPYMAPEQTTPRQPLTTRTDVYGLGAVLYELLTGRAPFPGKDMETVLRRVREENPLPPRTIDPRVPIDLEAICLRCLAKEPAERYGSAEELALDLNRFLNGEPIEAAPTSLGRRAWLWSRRHPALSVPAALTMAALIFFVILSMQLRTALGVARDQKTRADDNAELAGKRATEAFEAKGRAVKARDLAKQEAELKRVNLYTAAIKGAQLDWDAGFISRLMDAMAAQEPRPGESDLRGFEWYHLLQLCRQERYTLREHKGPVHGLALADDGETFFSCGDDGTIKRWSFESGKLLANWQVSKAPLSALAITSDGKTLATGGSTRSVYFVDTTTGATFFTLNLKTPITHLAATAKGVVAIGTRDDRVHVLDINDKRQGRTLSGSKGGMTPRLTDLAFSPDEKKLTACYSAWICEWDLNKWEKTRNIGFPQRVPVAVSYSPRDRILAIGFSEAMLGYVPYDSDQVKSLSGFHRDSFSTMGFSRDGSVFFTGGVDTTIKVQKPPWSQEIPTHTLLQGHMTTITSLIMSDDMKILASSSTDGTIKIWQLDDFVVPELMSKDRIQAIAFAPDGLSLAAGDALAKVNLVDTRTKRGTRSLPVHDAGVEALAYSPDGKTLATGNKNSVCLWNNAQESLQARWNEHTGQVYSLAYSPSGQVLASGAADGNVVLWNVGQGNKKAVLSGHSKSVRFVGFVTEDTLVSGSWDGTFIVWDLTSGKPKKQFKQDTAILSMALSDDGKLLAAGIAGRLLVWETSSWTLRFSKTGHTGGITAMAFSPPDGSRLATAGTDQMIRLWDPQSGEEKVAFHRGRSGFWSLAFSPDGRTLVAGSDEGRLQFLKAASPADAEVWIREYMNWKKSYTALTEAAPEVLSELDLKMPQPKRPALKQPDRKDQEERGTKSGRIPP